MNCNQINSISFKKKLVANANILSEGKPEKVSIYELDKFEEKDKFYFENLLATTDWRKGLFVRSLQRELPCSARYEHFYVMEDKENNCLGTIKINTNFKHGPHEDVEYIETCPKYANYHGQSSKKYIGETLLSFATKVFSNSDSEGISIASPTLPAEPFYTDKCYFFRESEDEYKVILPKKDFHKLTTQNEFHTNGKIEMVV